MTLRPMAIGALVRDGLREPGLDADAEGVRAGEVALDGVDGFVHVEEAQVVALPEVGAVHGVGVGGDEAGRRDVAEREYAAPGVITQ